MQRTNELIRTAMKAKNAKAWQVADLLGVHENTFYRMMRHELPEEKQREIITLIEDWARENNQ